MDLPGEVLDDVLQRVPPRHLAACRRVCKDWRAVIDGRGLVLAYLAPRPPRGIFINFFGKFSHNFFSRDVPTTTSPSLDSMLRFLPDWWMPYSSAVLDHSNGLILYANGDTMYVCNPLTRRWATLPPPRVPFHETRVCLMFDPALSLHYDVLYFPDVPERPTQPRQRFGKGRAWMQVSIQNLSPSLKSKYEHQVSTVGSMEWPPCSYAVQVFSSRTGQWQARHFVRQGNAAVTVSDVWSDPHAAKGRNPLRRHAVYLKGAFYLHCGDFVIRLSLLDQKYLVIKTPILANFLRGYFGKSRLGIYYTAVHGFQLSVWVLQEASNAGRTLEWELRHRDDLEPSFKRYYNRHPRGDDTDMSWTLDPNGEEASNIGDNGWDSDDDCVTYAREEGINSTAESYRKCYYGMDFLGYHPSKEIVFLGSRYNGFAYYLGTSKLQYLGALYPNGSRSYIPCAAPTLESNIYTPCVDDLLPAHHDP